MYKIEKRGNLYECSLDKKVYDTHAQAEFELKKLQMEIELHEHQLYAKEEQAFRLKIGLTNLEGDANILRDALLKASVELAFAVEMDHSKYIIKKAKLKASNTRKMYQGVRKKIFTICLKHGVKSEHSN